MDTLFGFAKNRTRVSRQETRISRKTDVKRGGKVYTDTWESYNALDMSDFHHERIKHTAELTNEKSHGNRIEHIWN
jgi:transposase